jgi:hypothetical protein
MSKFVKNGFMVINENAVYSIKEATSLLGINSRTLTRLAVKLNIQKIDNRYIFKGIDLINYLKNKDKEVFNYKDVLKDLDTSQTRLDKLQREVKTLSDAVKLLTIDNDELKKIIEEKDKLFSKKSDEAHQLKQKLIDKTNYMTSDIPHKEKLKEAIQLITLEAMEQNYTHKIFTDEEYDDLIGTISEVDFQKEQVNYLRNRVEKQDEVLTKLIAQVEASTKIITQQNFIEAKEKGFDN